MINIVRKGLANIPYEARKCPVCGKKQPSFMLEKRVYTNPLEAQAQECRIVNEKEYIQGYPTFICDNCQTIWQYLGEKEEEKE